MYYLPLPKSGRISQIIHLADIHIHDGDSNKSRYNEYLSVFNELFDSLRTINGVINGSAVAIIVGDILDHKIHIQAAGCHLLSYLIKGLSDLMPVYIVQGNHDFQQAFPNEPSILDSLLVNIPPNVCYMKKPGHYLAGDVGFGLLTVYETHKLGSGTGYADSIPEFPPVTFFPTSVKTKIALLHATISGCILQNYNPAQGGLPIDLMKDYDAILLGDIHLMNIQNALCTSSGVYSWVEGKKVWAYPGSLIQQNVGENAFNHHGYLLWDLEQRMITPMQVRNRSARLKISSKDKRWLVNIDNDVWKPLLEVISNYEHLELHIKNKFTTQDLECLYSLLKACNIVPNIKGLLRRSSTKTVDSVVSTCKQENGTKGFLEEVNSIDTCITFINQKKGNSTILDGCNWQDWFKDPSMLCVNTNMYPNMNENVVEAMENLNERVKKAGFVFTKVRPNKTTNIELKYMEWKWLLGYGDNCWINFAEMVDNICIANAPNGIGKSSIFDIICWIMFSRPTPLRANSITSSGIICKFKPSGVGASGSLTFQLNDELYKIVRIAELKESGKKTQSGKDSYLYKFSAVDQAFHSITQSATNIKKWIEANLGDLDEFISACMVTQNLGEDFFAKKPVDQLAILSRSINMDQNEKLNHLLNEARLGYKSLTERHTALKMGHLSAIPDNINDEQYKKLEIDHLILQDKLVESERSLRELQGRIKRDPEYLSELDTKVIENFLKKHELIHQLTEKYLITKYNLNLENIELARTKAVNILVNLQSEFVQYIEYYEKFYVPSPNDLELLENGCVEPPLNSQGLIEEEQRIKDWHQKWENFEYQPDNKIMLQTYLKHRDDIMQNMEKCTPTLIGNWDEKEYLIWLRIFENIHLDELNSLESFCVENPLIAPQTSNNSNNENEDMLSRDMQSFGISEEFLAKPPQFDLAFHRELLAKLSSQLDEITKKMEDLGTVSKPSPMEPGLSRPEISEDRVNNWLENYNDLKLNRTVVIQREARVRKVYEEINAKRQEVSEMERRINFINEQIAIIEKEDHPYNPECWACHKQTWRVHLDNLQNELLKTKLNLDFLKEQIAGLLDDFDKNVYNSVEDEYNTITGKVKDFEKMDVELSKYQMLVSEWNSYNAYTTRLNLYNVAFSLWNNSRDVFIELQSEREECSKLIKLETDLIHQLDGYLKHNERWSKGLAECQQIRNHWKQYNMNKDKHEKLQQYRDIVNKKPIWENRKLYRNLEVSLVQINGKLSNAQEMESLHEKHEQEKLQWQDRVRILEENKKAYQAWKAHALIRNRIKAYEIVEDIKKLDNFMALVKWMFILENQKLRLEEVHLLESLKSMKQRNEQFIRDICIYKDRAKIAAEYKAVAQMYDKYDVDFTRIYGAVCQLETWFKEYKQWIYDTHVIPALLEQTNLIVSLMYPENFSLQAESGKEGFTWIIQKNGELVPFTFGGSFEKFILGFAVKLAISRVGAGSIYCKQLFIDEGFTSADKNNLSKVPDLLQNLLDIYPTIFLVTHITCLQEVSDLSLNITRNNKVSQVQFGDKIEDITHKETLPQLKVAQMIEPDAEPIKLGIKPNLSGLKMKKLEIEVPWNLDKCQGLTQKGTQCTRLKKVGEYCASHVGKITNPK